MTAPDREHILVVDDDPELREAVQDILETMTGHAVRCAANGKEALEMLRAAPLPCAVLLDLMMPVMTGYEFLEAVRADAQLSDVPVIVVSAAGNDAVGPVAAFLTKPFTLESLLECLKEYCREDASRAAPAT